MKSAHRYESGDLTIISNQPLSHWDQIFPDTVMTVAAIDRIIHHAPIIEIEGENYRKKTAPKKVTHFSTKTNLDNYRHHPSGGRRQRETFSPNRYFY